MKQWILSHDASAIDGLIFTDAQMPEPGSGQVRIKVEAVSLDARYLIVIASPFARMPGRSVVPASDMAGTIDALVTDVTGWKIGNYVERYTLPAEQYRMGEIQTARTALLSAIDKKA